MIFIVLYWAITIAYIIRTVRMTIYYVFLWQLREYRMDRMLAHIKSPLGRKVLIGTSEQVKWFSFLLFIFSLPVLYFVWLVEAAIYIKELFTRGWHWPTMTPKAMAIIGLTLALSSLPLLTGTFVGVLLLGPFMDRLLFYIAAFFTGMLQIPTFVWREWVFWRAGQKRGNLRNLQVIGITGSYGKTSTKEYLATILKEKFHSIKTPESKNADIGIAQWFLSEAAEDVEIAVVEIGILKQGEMQRICRMIRPDIAVVTGIGDQHIELFGSYEAIKLAKYELVESLPRAGAVLVNGNNAHSIDMAAWAKRDGIKTVITSKTNKQSQIREFTDHCTFTFQHGKKTHTYTVNVLGKQAVENIILAIHVAQYLGMSPDQISRGVARIEPVEQTMKPYVGKSGITYIDDTFNASTSGVIAGLQFLRRYSGSRVLVLTPLIELGTRSRQAHRELGKLTAEICDSVWLTNSNYYQDIREGVSSVTKRSVIVRLVDSAKTVRQLGEIQGKNDGILFEGKEARKILASLRGTYKVR